MTAQGTLPSLTAMRWMAATLVFGLHLHNLGYLGGATATLGAWAFRAGSTGVSFFFVLSGFVLTLSARPRDTASGFWLRRIARIYPVHIATAVIAAILGSTVLGESRASGPQIAANLLLMSSWRHAWWQTLNPVSWSLACEAFFYATFPALFWALRRLGPRTLTVIAAGAALSVVILPLVGGHVDLGLVPYTSPLARLPEFVLGVTLAQLVLLGCWRGPGLDACTALTVIGYFLASQVGAPYSFAACTILGFALLIPAAALADLNGLPSMWRHPWLVRLGELSFAFYMIHILVLHAGATVLTAIPAPAGAAAGFTASLLAAWLLHESVERPSRRLILGITRRRPEPTSPRRFDARSSARV